MLGHTGGQVRCEVSIRMAFSFSAFFSLFAWNFRKYFIYLPPITDMKTKTEILQLLRRYKPKAQKKYGMTKIGIFGSVARGEQKEESDIDVCYEGEAPSFLTLDMIQSELEQLLGSKVDIVRVRENMNSLLRQRILKDGIYV